MQHLLFQKLPAELLLGPFCKDGFSLELNLFVLVIIILMKMQCHPICLERNTQLLPAGLPLLSFIPLLPQSPTTSL